MEGASPQWVARQVGESAVLCQSHSPKVVIGSKPLLRGTPDNFGLQILLHADPCNLTGPSIVSSTQDTNKHIHPGLHKENFLTTLFTNSAGNSTVLELCGQGAVGKGHVLGVYHGQSYSKKPMFPRSKRLNISLSVAFSLTSVVPYVAFESS